jgi:hypothetical protein
VNRFLVVLSFSLVAATASAGPSSTPSLETAEVTPATPPAAASHVSAATPTATSRASCLRTVYVGGDACYRKRDLQGYAIAFCARYRDYPASRISYQKSCGPASYRKIAFRCCMISA